MLALAATPVIMAGPFEDTLLVDVLSFANEARPSLLADSCFEFVLTNVELTTD